MSQESLRKALEEIRDSLHFANESPNSPIQDTIWMMHRPETLFDFIDATLEEFSAEPAQSQDELPMLSQELLDALKSYDDGCDEKGFRGCENGHGEEVGIRIDAAVKALRRALKARASIQSGQSTPASKPLAWMRLWAHEGRKPESDERGRKLLPVTINKCVDTDIPLARLDADPKENE